MGFVRKWDSSCPRVYDSWHSNGAKWSIQDLPPEDDKKALHLLINYLIPDEPLCSLSKFIDDPESLKCITDIWRECLRQRMTLACYIEEEGEKTLAALNVCIVDDVDERFPTIKVEGEAWKNVFSAMEYVQRKCDPFKYLGCSRILNAFGLVVKKEYRGQKLGSRILSARELLCHPHGIQATSTIFSGPASQISAVRCGFKPISEASLKELAENGLKYPPDENRSIKLMVKSFV
ncbi:unnamed protein product [Danaus chrysippus]|uniref:(African queen) hypothetical protein n=1 Tax=Danaus chrysippus TaxID=151541 RepID=A0A8J2QY25_9NEOP|nr:unnamed protein product [Danaus chrysippus]